MVKGNTESGYEIKTVMGPSHDAETYAHQQKELAKLAVLSAQKGLELTIVPAMRAYLKLAGLLNLCDIFLNKPNQSNWT